MSDIVERLRRIRYDKPDAAEMLGDFAANEIVLLRQEAERLRETNRAWLKENAPGGWIDTYRSALEIIAGKRRSIDNLMGNADIARAALAAPIPPAFTDGRDAE